MKWILMHSYLFLLLSLHLNYPTPTRNLTKLSSRGDMLKTTSKSVHLGLPEYSTTNSIPLSPDGSLDTHIHRSLYTQQRRPDGYFRLESKRRNTRTPKLYLPAIQFLRRLAQRQVAFLRRMSQNPRLLHHQSQ